MATDHRWIGFNNSKNGVYSIAKRKKKSSSTSGIKIIDDFIGSIIAKSLKLAEWVLFAVGIYVIYVLASGG